MRTGGASQWLKRCQNDGAELASKPQRAHGPKIHLLRTIGIRFACPPTSKYLASGISFFQPLHQARNQRPAYSDLAGFLLARTFRQSRMLDLSEKCNDDDVLRKDEASLRCSASLGQSSCVQSARGIAARQYRRCGGHALRSGSSSICCWSAQSPCARWCQAQRLPFEC